MRAECGDAGYAWSPSIEEAFVAPMIGGSAAGLVVALLQLQQETVMRLKTMNLDAEPRS